MNGALVNSEGGTEVKAAMPSDQISTRVVWPNYSKNNVQAAAKSKGDTLGKDDFLKILVTQLRNQDPMQPMQDRDFIAQMAQFSSVEQLMNMSGEMTKLRQNLGMASSMIGKEVTWYDYAVNGELVPFKGTVDSILIKDGVQYAQVGQKDIPFDNIVGVREVGSEAPQQPGEQQEQPEQPEQGQADGSENEQSNE